MSQIPSRSTLDARRSRDRYPHCPTCTANDVSGLHVDHCAEMDRFEKAAIESGYVAGIPPMATADLWAHVNSRGNAILATSMVRLVIDLGWRPVVDSDPKRLWTTPTTNPAAAATRAQLAQPTHPPHDPAASAADEED